MTGKTLLHYEILQKLGEGGMGIVYKARDTHLDRFVAIKFLSPKAFDPTRRARFVTEAKAASALQHPNIVTIHDIVRAGDQDFIVMEYVDGKTLEEWIGRRGLKVNEAVRLAIETADALARAHGAGIVHRDLKPSNLMVDKHGHVKVVDFGLAKLAEGGPGGDGPTLSLRPRTEEGTIVGTVSYMSPEQAEGRLVDARSDIFSFGAVLYEMLAGRRAFAGDSRMSTLAAILNRDPAPLPDDVPAELQRTVMRCLRKDPARRWQSIADVKVALEDIKEETDSGKLTPVTRTARRRWRPAVFGAFSLLAMLVAGSMWYRSGRPIEGPPVLEAVPLTSYPGAQLMPSFSPDGSQVAFVSCDEQGCAIYVKQMGVEEPYRLSKPPDNAFSPQWSPDGAYIAFVRKASSVERGVTDWQSEAVTRHEYVLVPQRGGTERVIAQFPAPTQLSLPIGTGAVAWTPDSKNLIVVGAEVKGGFTSLYALSLATGERRRILDHGPAESDGDPAVSADGQWLAFCRSRSQWSSELLLVPLTAGPAASGPPVKIKPVRDFVILPAWLPDSRELIFPAGSPQRMDLDLFRVAPNARDTPQRVPLPEGLSGPVAISKQGRLVYTGAQRDDVDLFRIRFAGPSGTWSVPEKFISSTRFEMEPQFSPDGSRIAVTSGRSGTGQIWLFNSDGTNPMCLTPSGPQQTIRARWSPDGRWIAFYGSSGGKVDVYVVNPEAGRVRRLTDGLGRYQNQGWSCDSRYVYYESDRGQVVETWKVAVSGGPPTLVMRTQDASGVGESADCRFLLYESGFPDRYTLWRKPLPDGSPQVLAESMYPGAGYQVFPDGTYYVGNPGAAKDYPILFRNTATGAVSELARVTHPFWGFTVSPDRKTILYAAGELGGTNLMMIEGFR